jgi:hypothetical protein
MKKIVGETVPRIGDPSSDLSGAGRLDRHRRISAALDASTVTLVVIFRTNSTSYVGIVEFSVEDET